MERAYASPSDIVVRVADFIKKECIPKIEIYTYNAEKNKYEMKRPQVHLQYIPPRMSINGTISEDVDQEYPFIIVRFLKQSIKNGTAIVSVELRLGAVGNSLVPKAETDVDTYERIEDSSGMADILHMVHVIYTEMFDRVELPFSLCKDTFITEAKDELQNPPFFHMTINFDVDAATPTPKLEKWLEHREGLYK